MAVGMGMDVLTVAARDPADHIGLPVLEVAMDIQSGDGEQIPDGQQEGRQQARGLGSVLLRIHCCKFSIKKLYL